MSRGGKKGGSRVPASDLHANKACWFLFLLSAYLVVAGAASFDKKELCRSDTLIVNVVAVADIPIPAISMSRALISVTDFSDFSDFSGELFLHTFVVLCKSDRSAALSHFP